MDRLILARASPSQLKGKNDWRLQVAMHRSRHIFLIKFLFLVDQQGQTDTNRSSASEWQTFLWLWCGICSTIQWWIVRLLLTVVIV